MDLPDLRKDVDWTRFGMLVVESPEAYVYLDASGEVKRIHLILPEESFYQMYKTLAGVFGKEGEPYAEEESV